MKKTILAKLSLLLTVVMLSSVLFAGCGFFGDNGKTYVIQYTDDEGTHQITVTKGMPYYLESIPSRYGYEFLGLFDAQTGGTQYVAANGSSLTTFNDNENMVLYPQFKAIDYTVILDYQGADITGERSLTVAYGTNLPELPKNLHLDHHVFTGWYTKAGAKGKQIADVYGNIAGVSVLNATNFELDDTTHRVTLYAGFDVETYTVTFHFDGGLPNEEVKVSYNTSISEVVPKTRNSEGFAGLVWSKTPNDTTQTGIFNGKVTGNMDLYVVEWAPVIDFNVNGGDEVTPIVARAGSSISLPTPTKSLAKFLYWKTTDGQKANITTMPAASTTLDAVWQAVLAFDTNGGSEVKDISVSAGTTITLPTTTKDGFIFAGWYTSDKEKYENTTMPAEGILLKAGWYKEIVDEKVTITGSTRIQMDSKNITAPALNKFCFEIDVSKYTADGPVTIKFDAQGKYYSNDGATTVYANFYSRKVVNDSYLMTTESFKSTGEVDAVFNFNKTFTVSQNFYICFYQAKSGPWGSWITNFYYTITYPDTSTLYL